MLQKLEIRALRGATQPFTLAFEKGKRITILYGENGSGKSTICDAIELLTCGKIGSLEDKGLGKTQQFWCSTGKTPADMEVRLTTSNGQWTAKIARSKVIVQPEPGRPEAAILRRGQILELIAGQPKTRFDAIRPFLDTASVEQSEETLRKLIEEEKAHRETALARIDENRGAVENFWKEAASPGPDPLSWARAEIERDTTQLSSELAHLDKLIRCIEALISEHGRLDERRHEIREAAEKSDAWGQRVAGEQARVSNELGELLSVLEAAKSYFVSHAEVHNCPLCGSTEFAEGLPVKVNSQLDSIKGLAAARQQQEEARKQLAAAQGQERRQAQALLKAADEVVQVLQERQLPRDVTLPTSFLNSPLGFASAPIGPENLALVDKLVSEVASLIDNVRNARDARKQRDGFVQTLRRAVKTYDDNYGAQAEMALLLPRLEAALAEIRAERKQFTDEILQGIATEVGQLYEAIHPGEGLNKISLLLDPNKRASLDILGAFPEVSDVPPGAYFSESHLDTLGLCIWLALAGMKNPTETILVLDDVIASVDEPHVDRVIEMLYEVAPKFQHCIFATHYRPWSEKYRWGWLQNGQCHFVELHRWHHESGIKQIRSVPPIEELRSLLATDPPRIQLVCASAGVTLEAILDFLTQLYECPVPRKRGGYTLGDLLPAVSKKLRAALTIERQEIAADGTASYVPCPLGGLLDELTRIMQARNVFGAHFNELASHLPPDDGLRFAEVVLTLAEHLIDVEHGWPRSDKSGSYWANAAQTRRLHPLKQPG